MLDGGRWVFDLELLKKSITPKTKAFFLCNPQNPGGTVFRRAELERLAEVSRDLIIVSDEIHCDLVLDPGLKHVPIASLSPGNLAPHGDAHVGEQDLQHPCRRLRLGDHRRFRLCRNQFSREVSAHVVGSPSVFGLAATLAALEHGDEWLAAQLDYLRGNRDLVEKEIGLPMAHVEATYLAWIDCSSLEDAAGLFLKHGVSVYGGAQFGDARFIRLNFGTQRKVLEEALLRIRASLTIASRPSPRG